MINMQQVMAIARTEMRLTRRLVRYWLFLLLGYLLGILGYFYYSGIHAFLSSWSASAASIGPKFLVGAFGFYYLMVFMIGLVFLGFDVRARDERERMLEVLDSRPYSNLELVLGKLVGLFLPVWVPVVFLALLWQGLGFALTSLGAPIGDTVELFSLFGFVVFMAVPEFIFVLGLVYLVTMLVRNRLVSMIILIVVLGLSFWGTLRLPIGWARFFDITGAYQMQFASEIIPGVATLAGWVQRGGILLCGLALVGMAAAIHPRLDDGNRPRQMLGSLAIFLLGVVLLGNASFSQHRIVNQIQGWEQAHRDVPQQPFPKMVSLVGDVTMQPGKSLDMNLQLTFAAPQDAPLSKALFTFNPGQKVVAIKDDSGGDVAFNQVNGLLELNLKQPLEAGAQTTVNLVTSGKPDLRFGYFNSAIKPESLSPWRSQIILLGVDRGFYRRNYVALMPGLRWLPASGVEYNRDDPTIRQPDYYTVDLEVTVPKGWLVAGPGKRQPLDKPGRFRFAPGGPVPEVALIAGEFETRSAEIEGVTFEMLLHPKHTKNFEVLSPAGQDIKDWIGERMQAASEAGLAYPYDGFSMVEVPSFLRGYGGGWRMDTTFAPPAMVLMRESSLPTARFDSALMMHIEKDDEGRPRAIRNRLHQYFLNDFSGGNVFTGISRNFFNYQTAATGADGLALNFVTENLTARLVTDSKGYFSAHMYTPELQKAIGDVVTIYLVNRRGEEGTMADAVLEAFTSRQKVWDTVLDVSLRDLVPQDDPARTIDILTLKAGGLADSLYDGWGPERAGRLLAGLRQAHGGSDYQLEDLITLAGEQDIDPGETFNDWLTSTKLPGFFCESGSVTRLPDTEDGQSRYQLEVVLRNDEPVAGLVRVGYTLTEPDSDKREKVLSEPIRLEGQSRIRYGVSLSTPPVDVEIEPYLSLNRRSFEVNMPTLDARTIVEREAFNGVETLPWQQTNDGAIVVDDLDPGFSIEAGEQGNGMRLGARELEGEVDGGLPVVKAGKPPTVWSRTINDSSYGHYRHTLAAIKSGDKGDKAVFKAVIPHGGPWDLELFHSKFVPTLRARKWSEWHLEIYDGRDTTKVSFDAGAAANGWNLVGAYELPAGEVTVRLLDQSDGRLVVADAIRWKPSVGNPYKEKPQ